MRGVAGLLDDELRARIHRVCAADGGRNTCAGGDGIRESSVDRRHTEVQADLKDQVRCRPVAYAWICDDSPLNVPRRAFSPFVPLRRDERLFWNGNRVRLVPVRRLVDAELANSTAARTRRRHDAGAARHLLCGLAVAVTAEAFCHECSAEADFASPLARAFGMLCEAARALAYCAVKLLDSVRHGNLLSLGCWVDVVGRAHAARKEKRVAKVLNRAHALRALQVLVEEFHALGKFTS